MANSPSSTPESKFKTQGGTELHMSYGMFTDIMRLLGNGEETVTLLMTDANVRDWVIRRLFTDRKKPVNDIEELINPYDIDVSPLELDDIIAWVADHAMHFTMSTAEKTRPVVAKYQARADNATAS